MSKELQRSQPILCDAKVLKVDDLVEYNSLTIRCIAKSTRSITISMPMYNNDTLTIYTPSSGILVGNSLTFNVVEGDVIKIQPTSGNWGNLKYFSLYSTYLQYEFNAFIDKISHVEQVSANTCTSYIDPSKDTIPEGTRFPNLVKWSRVYLNMTIEADTFNPNIYGVDNSKMIIPVGLLTTAYPLLRDISCYPTGSFQDMPIDNYGALYFSDAVAMTGDPGTFLNALNDAGKYIRRPSFGNYESDEIVNVDSLFNGASVNGSMRNIKVNVSTAYYLKVTIGSNKALGTIVAYDDSVLGMTQGAQWIYSIVDGDLGVWRNTGYNINTAHFGFKIYSTRITTYTKDTGTDGVDKVGMAIKQLYWYDCAADKDYGSITYSEITEQTLVDLIDDKYYYVTNNDQQYGTLQIGSYNPAITNQTALYQIEHLTTPVDGTVATVESPYYGLNGYGWTIIHN